MSELAVFGGPPAFDAKLFDWPRVQAEDSEALLAAVTSGRWWRGVGERGDSFAESFARYHDCDFGLAVTNGTHSLQVALAALGISPGAEVILPSYTFIATATAVLQAFAVPVFVDVEPTTFCLDPAAVESAIGPRTEAIIAVHLAGHPADMDALGSIAGKHGLALIEDAAQAPGAEWRGRKAGSLGTVGSFSFQGTKTVTAGEGGLLTTDDEALADRIYSVINAGRKREGGFYDHFILGSNYRMTELQAALLRSQFAQFPRQHEQRQVSAANLSRLLREVPGITPQARDERATSHGFYTYTVLYDEAEFGGLSRKGFMQALAAEGLPLIGTYPPLHRTQLFLNLRRECPAVFKLSRFVPAYERLHLPQTDWVMNRAVNFKHALLLAGPEATNRLVELIEMIRADAARVVAWEESGVAKA